MNRRRVVSPLLNVLVSAPVTDRQEPAETAPGTGFRTPRSVPTPTEDHMGKVLRRMVLALCGIVAFGSAADAQAANGTCRTSDEMSVRVVDYLESLAK